MSVVILALAGASEAQDTFIAGDGTSVEPFIAEDLGPPDAFSVDLPLRLELPLFTDLPRTSYLDQVTMTERIPGGLSIRYRGLQGVAVKWLGRRLRSEWRRSIKRNTETSLDAAGDRRAAGLLRANMTQDHNAGGRWWDRRWFHSLMPEDGGAPAKHQVHDVGSRITILELGPLTINNEFRGRLGRRHHNLLGFQLGAGDDTGFMDREQAVNEDEREGENRSVLMSDDDELLPPNSGDLWIGLETASVGAWGMSAKLKVRPGVHTAFTSSGVSTDLRLKLVVEIAFGIEKREGIDVEFLVRCNPLEETDSGAVDASAEFKITFLRW